MLSRLTVLIESRLEKLYHISDELSIHTCGGFLCSTATCVEFLIPSATEVQEYEQVGAEIIGTQPINQARMLSIAVYDGL